MSKMATSGPSKIGLSAEEWVRHWDTDFVEFSSHDQTDPHHDHGDNHGHGGHEQGHHDHKGDGSGEGCGGQNYLLKYLPKLTQGEVSVSILVSLCGDASDVRVLAQMGHKVTGIEVSEKAVKSIFENETTPVPYSVADKGEFKFYTATNDLKMSVFVGNFFGNLPDDVCSFDVIWDGHGIVSLPNKDMKPYAEKLSRMLRPGGRILFSTVDYNVEELTKGPAPCPVSTGVLASFLPGYEIELLENNDFDNSGFEGVAKVTNPIIMVTKPKK